MVSPEKVQVGSRSPRKDTSWGLLGVPRSIVWFMPHPLVRVGVDVGPPSSPLICIGHGSVDFKTCVSGLLVRVLRRFCLMVGLSAFVAPMAARPVAVAEGSGIA